jgi:hypothetical protein
VITKSDIIVILFKDHHDDNDVMREDAQSCCQARDGTRARELPVSPAEVWDIRREVIERGGTRLARDGGGAPD